MTEDQARYGWGSNFPNFSRTPARIIRGKLEEFVRDAGDSQLRAWDDSIPPLQREVEEVLSVNESADAYSAILEYELPLESRRPDVDGLIDRLAENPQLPQLSRERFLSESAYCPLPSLVKAARELFHSGNLRTIKRARAATDPAVDEISRIIHEAAATRTRRLVLLTGIPGPGKTLVGLRIVHAHSLDDLAIPRANGKPTAPAIFLSGNGPPRRCAAVRIEVRGRSRQGIRQRGKRLCQNLLSKTRTNPAGTCSRLR